MLTGKIKFFEYPRNFGMIEQNEEGPDVFFHRSVLDGIPSPQPGLFVAFELVPDYRHENGTLKAKKVSLCKKRVEHGRSMDRERSGKVLPFGSD